MSDELWQQGWRDGHEFALKNFDPVKGYSVPFPSKFVHRGDSWSCGFAEGEICGHGKVFDKKYKVEGKQLLSITWVNGQYQAKYK